MNVLQNVVGLFSSPAKGTPARPSPARPTSAKKRNYRDMSSIRSPEEMKRASYDPQEYQNATYGGAGTMTVTDEEEEGEQDEESEEDEDEEEATAQEQLFQEQLRLEDLRRYTRPTVTSKSVRRYTRALSSAIYAKPGSASDTTFDAALASNNILDKTEKLLAKQPDSKAKRRKLATIEQARAKNNAIMSKAEVEGYMQAQREESARVAAAMASVDSESASEEGVMQEINDNVEIDWTEEEYYGSSTTPQRHLYTVHEERASTSELFPTVVEADRLKHSPVTKQPRSQTCITFKLPNGMTYPDHWSTMTPEQKWMKDPNLRARELDSNPELIRAELKDEPEYAFRDAEIRDGIWALMNGIENFSKTWFPHGADSSSLFQGDNGDRVVDQTFYEGLIPETGKIIACIASSGPSGIWGWHDLFVNAEKLQALVCGIIGNVVSEQVFQHAFFGGTDEGLRAVRAVEVEHREADGFDRKILYAKTIREHLPSPTSLPENFNAHVNVIVGALWTHLSPLLSLVHPTTTPTLTTLFTPLHRLATQAALLSLHMSTSPHTIYHHVPLFKEDTYVSSSMECFNQHSMRLRNPHTPLSSLSCIPPSSDFKPTQEELDTETARRTTLSEAEKRRAGGDTALTQIVCMEGITAYRRGGWETSPSNTCSRHEKPVFEKMEFADMGIRARILTHGWTYCRWGRARSLQNSASLDETIGRKIHGDAWREGGFVDFSDVKGVVDWVGLERAERKRRWEERMEREGKVDAGQSNYLERLGDPDL